MGKHVEAGATSTLSRADLLQLQSRMKQDPGGYEAELKLQLRHFRACLDVLALQGAQAAKGQDHATAKELGDMAMFLAHVTSSYPQLLAEFPSELLHLLHNLGPVLPAALRRQLAQAIILLRNREKVDLVDALPVMMRLQSLGDKALKKLIFSHIISNIGQMNRKHRNEAKNRALQNVVCPLLQDENEARAKDALVLLCELYRRKVWVDDRTANSICSACLHKSSRLMVATLKFLHGLDTSKYDDESDDSENEEEDDTNPAESVALNREAVYKAYHKGTASSRKKKQAKLERALRSMKKQQKTKAEADARGNFAPLQQLHDPQGFAEKLYARLRECNERFQVKLMMIMAISRCIGVHKLVLLNFYSYLLRYIAPHQQEETQLLAALVQACHDKVPTDAVESLLKQLVNSFVHDRSRPEVIAVGLNVVREMCARMPLIMNRDLLEDLSMYKKYREKAVSSAANSIIALYRQVNPTLLKKKDRGRGTDLTVQPKAFGEATFHTGVPGVELLDAQEEEEEDKDDRSEDSEDEINEQSEEVELSSEVGTEEEEEEEEGEEDDQMDEVAGSGSDQDEDVDEDDEGSNAEDEKEEEPERESPQKRRKIQDEDEGGCIALNDMSLSQLKQLAVAKSEGTAVEINDGILSNEDFKRIRELQMQKAAKQALASEGLAKSGKKDVKLPKLDSGGERPVNPAIFEANIRKRKTREERIASSKAGREDRAAYGARTAIKHKKTGGLTNRQKEKKKNVPIAARRAKVARSIANRKSKRKSSKQFRGKKAWKS